jgi:hypothetical protein
MYLTKSVVTELLPLEVTQCTQAFDEAPYITKAMEEGHFSQEFGELSGFSTIFFLVGIGGPWFLHGRVCVSDIHAS